MTSVPVASVRLWYVSELVLRRSELTDADLRDGSSCKSVSCWEVAGS